LWQLLPAVYHQCAVAYTDFGQACALFFPQERYNCGAKKLAKQGGYIKCSNGKVCRRVYA
ncbi:MAG: IS1 family transposase, partial [Cyanobacteria bacterium J06555_12]